MSNAFDAPHFTNPEAARLMIEGIRWSSGPVCPHCGVINHAYATKRAGLYRCAEPECRKDFTCTTGTVMERSRIPLHKWLTAFYLMNASKKGISAHQLHRTLDIGYEAAWFMCHRIREAMRDGGLSPLGGEGKIVEADETYYGRTKGKRKLLRPRSTPYLKEGCRIKGAARPIVGLGQRGGKVLNFHLGQADKHTVTKNLRQNIAKESKLHHHERNLYTGSEGPFTEHETVKHNVDEYVRYKR